MSAYKLIYIILYLVLSMPVLSYGRYLHDEAGNRSGAAAVFALVVFTGFGIYKMT